MKSFLGGYYLLKLRPLSYGSQLGKTVYTASDCINDNLLGDWAYSWAALRQSTKLAKDKFRISDEDLDRIGQWVEAKHVKNLVGWINLFAAPETAIEFQRTFFSHLDDLRLMSLYFDSHSADQIVEEFKPPFENHGEIGLYQNLSKCIPEDKNSDETLIGYDLIGIEEAGDFHSFHCHDIGKELCEKFGLVINDYGLFEPTDSWDGVLDFLNDEKNGCEPVPWFVARTKLVDSKTVAQQDFELGMKG
jgi:hypothetical protein